MNDPDLKALLKGNDLDRDRGENETRRSALIGRMARRVWWRQNKRAVLIGLALLTSLIASGLFFFTGAQISQGLALYCCWSLICIGAASIWLL